MSDDNDDTEPQLVGLEKSILFTSSDRKVLIRDVEYWASTMDALLQFYKRTKAESKEDLSVRALACARLAGFGLAMVEHFSIGVQSLVDVDNEESPDMLACTEASDRWANAGDAHRAKLEKHAQLSLS